MLRVAISPGQRTEGVVDWRVAVAVPTERGHCAGARSRSDHPDSRGRSLPGSRVPGRVPRCRSRSAVSGFSRRHVAGDTHINKEKNMNKIDVIKTWSRSP